MTIDAIMATANKVKGALERVGEPIVLLLTRLYMFDVFFTSGKSKLDNYLNGDWSTTVYLFEEIHPVPFLPANVSAVMGTAGEVILSSLLLMGLFGRFAAFGLLIMTGVIEISFNYVDPEYTTFDSHYMWALLLSVLMVRGAGTLSVDTLFFGALEKKESGKNPVAA